MTATGKIEEGGMDDVFQNDISHRNQGPIINYIYIYPGLEINFFSYVPIGQVIPNCGCPC